MRLRLVLLVLTVAPLASAAPSEAEVLFREGRTAMQEKNYDKACAKFAASQEKEPAPGTALSLGDCEEQRGHLVAASDAFALAARTFTSPDKKKYARDRGEAVDRRVPRLTVRSSVRTNGLVVKNGAAGIPLDKEIKVDPGELTLRAEAPQKKPKELHPVVREGRTLEVDVGALEDVKLDTGLTPATAPAAPATPSRGRTRREETLRALTFVAGGLGVASLAVGGVTGVLSLKKASTVKDHCDASNACDAEGVDAASSGGTFSTVSTITVASGGALVVGAAALWYFGWRPKKAAISPLAWRDGAGLVLAGSF